MSTPIRLLRPRVSSFHPEALTWRARVISAGGHVSERTMRAVSKFCSDTDAAGIRDRFYRLNLMCGGFIGCFHPLYLNISPSLSNIGSIFDINAGSSLFGSNDFAENVGLNSNGVIGNSFKYLDTGINTQALPTLLNGHMAVFRGIQSTNGITTFGLMGTRIATTQVYEIRQTGTDIMRGIWGGAASPIVQESVGSSSRRWCIVSRTATTGAGALQLYINASSVASSATTTSPSNAAIADTFLVYGWRTPTSQPPSTELFPGIISSYSIGSGMNSAQVSAYYNALISFMSSIGRPTA